MQLVKLVTEKAQTDDFGENVQPLDTLVTWDTALAAEPADVQAGYLLAEYYARDFDARGVDVLEKLHQLRPSDVGVVRELVRR